MDLWKWTRYACDCLISGVCGCWLHLRHRKSRGKPKATISPQKSHSLPSERMSKIQTAKWRCQRSSQVLINLVTYLRFSRGGGLLKSRAGLSWWGTVLLCITGINTQGEDGSSTHIPLIYYIPKMILNETLQWGQTLYHNVACDILWKSTKISSVLFMRLR